MKEDIKFSCGAIREDKTDKLRFDLIPISMLKRLAKRYGDGAKRYGDRNWEKGDEEFAEKCKESAWRHFISWQEGDKGEDHASAIVFNVFAYEYLMSKNYDCDIYEE